MSDRAACLWLIALAIVALLYEAAVIYLDRWDLTISTRVLTVADRSRFAVIAITGCVSFVAGVLIGHCLWPQR